MQTSNTACVRTLWVHSNCILWNLMAPETETWCNDCTLCEGWHWEQRFQRFEAVSRDQLVSRHSIKTYSWRPWWWYGHGKHHCSYEYCPVVVLQCRIRIWRWWSTGAPLDSGTASESRLLSIGFHMLSWHPVQKTSSVVFLVLACLLSSLSVLLLQVHSFSAHDLKI